MESEKVDDDNSGSDGDEEAVPSRRDRISLVDLFLKDLRKHHPLSAGEERRLGTIIQRTQPQLEELADREERLMHLRDRGKGHRRKVAKFLCELSPDKRYEVAEIRLEVERLKRRKTYQAARQKLVLHNVRLILSVAKSCGFRLAFMNRLSAGIPGLFRAAELFDPKKGFRFSTYAFGWIRQGIVREEEALGRIIRLPENTVRDYARTNKVGKGLELTLGRPPTDEELAEELTVMYKRGGAKLPETLASEMAIETTRERIRNANAVSLDRAASDHGETDGRDALLTRIEYGEGQGPFQSPEDILGRKEVTEALHRVISNGVLTDPRFKVIIHDRFLRTDPLTLEQVGERLGLSRGGVSFLERKALKEIRAALKNTLGDVEIF